MLWDDDRIFGQLGKMGAYMDGTDVPVEMAEGLAFLMRDEYEGRLAEPTYGLTVNEYQIAGDGLLDGENVTLKRMPQRKGPDKWAVYDGNHVLDKDGDFVWEPLPSSRTDEWLAFHRFASADEALAFYRSKCVTVDEIEL